MSNCPKCGYPIAPDETVCANCGELAENKTEEFTDFEILYRKRELFCKETHIKMKMKF